MGLSKHQRARAGGLAGAKTNKAYPLRKVVSRERDGLGLEIEILECGHRMRPVHDMAGEYSAARRRCRDCGSKGTI